MELLVEFLVKSERVFRYPIDADVDITRNSALTKGGIKSYNIRIVIVI